VLEWARQTLFDGSFDQFDQAVSASPTGANGVTFLPYLAGARAPVWEPAACGTFHGLSAQTSKADMARAVYEGLCFSLHDIIATIESCGVPVTSIRLGGGLSRNPLLNQMKADVTGKTIFPLIDQEVTTLGSATVAARQLGWLQAGESFSTAGPAIEPKQSVTGDYREAFARYRNLIATLWGR
jgi:sugar (pentulose or hexulose) kinase